VSTAWRKTDAGYDLEFLIPAKALAPAKSADGTALGFHYVLTVGGAPVETFVDTAPFQSVTGSPIFLGTLRLAEK
jgi:hypothetical protein